MSPLELSETRFVDTAPTVVFGSDQLKVTPAAGGSETQTVTVTVNGAKTTSDIDSVSLCAYQTVGGDENCAIQDTTNTAKMTWTRATQQVALLAGDKSTWSEQQSTSTYSQHVLAMVLNFRFKVGAVARQGQWTLRVQAVDSSGTVSNIANQPMTVKYFGIISGRPGQTYSQWRDVPGAGARSALAENVTDGIVITNAPSYITMQLDDQFATSRSLSKVRISGGLPTDAVIPDQFAVDCNRGAAFNEPSADRLTTHHWAIEAVAATGEAGYSGTVNSCRLSMGAVVPLGGHTMDVSTGIRQA